MPSLTITKRKTASGPRYVVRYRLGGRAYPVEHGGSFKTEREAKARQKLIGGEIAAGRNPRTMLDQMRTPVVAQTLASIAEQYKASRVDAADQTREKITSHLNAILPALGDKAPEKISRQDVQAWINGLTLKPSSTKRYLATLRLILDYAGVDPNPARDSQVRLPRSEREIPKPPSGREVDLIIGAVVGKYRLMLRLLAETGMRVGEACALAWGDVDFYGGRLRVQSGKTAAARRWVPINDELMEAIQLVLPPDDRTPDRRVFPNTTTKSVDSAMRRACVSGGVAHYHPHDLRHRWISLQVKRGVPITEIAAHVGHAKTSLTLDTYAHVLLEEEDD